MSSIEEMLKDITPEQVLSIMKDIKTGVRRIDTGHRMRRNKMNDLYFSVATLPHKTTYEEYKLHAEGIRQQVISGVDL